MGVKWEKSGKTFAERHLINLVQAARVEGGARDELLALRLVGVGLHVTLFESVLDILYACRIDIAAASEWIVVGYLAGRRLWHLRLWRRLGGASVLQTLLHRRLDGCNSRAVRLLHGHVVVANRDVVSAAQLALLYLQLIQRIQADAVLPNVCVVHLIDWQLQAQVGVAQWGSGVALYHLGGDLNN